MIVQESRFMRNIKIFDKNKPKAANRMLLSYSWKLFMKIFIKVVAARHRKWKTFQKQTSTIYLQLRYSTEKQIQLYKCYNNSPYFCYFFSNFLFFDSRVLIFLCFVFCLTEAATGGVLRNVARFTEKHLCQVFLLIKLLASGLQLY